MYLRLIELTEVVVHAGFDEFAHHLRHGFRMTGVLGRCFQSLDHGVWGWSQHSWSLLAGFLARSIEPVIRVDCIVYKCPLKVNYR